MKYAWIASNKAHWPITLACEVLGVSASGYFENGRRKKLPQPSKPLIFDTKRPNFPEYQPASPIDSTT